MGRLSTSGYCLTCRQRRVKCDRGKPNCQRCAKSGHRCQGYEGLVIRMDKWCPPANTPSKTATPLVRSPPLLRVTSWSSAPLMRRQPGVVVADSDATALRLAMPAAADTLDHWVSHYQWAPWWKYVLQLGLKTDVSGAAHKAASSLLSGYYAKHKGNNKVFMESRRYYGESLALVSQALTFHTHDSLPMMVLPIMIMSMHPYVFDSSIEFEHHIGLGIVLENCGPANFQRLTGVFRSCRSIIVCQAYARRERTFLEDPKWKTVPFALEGKTTMDYLYDIALYIPGLFEDIHAMRAGKMKNNYDWLAMRHKTLQTQFDAWHAKWEAERPTNSEIVPEPSPDASRQTHVHPFMLKYGTLSRAIEAIAHFSSCIYLDKLGELIALGPGATAGTSTEPQAPSSALVHVVRLCEWVTGELATCRTSCLLAPVPIAIVFCALKDLGGPGDELADSLASSCKVAQEELQQLQVYDIWRPGHAPAAVPTPVMEKFESAFCRGGHGRSEVEGVRWS